MVESEYSFAEEFIFEEAISGDNSTLVNVMREETNKISFEDHVLVHIASEYVSLNDPQATIQYAADKVRAFPLLEEELLNLFEALDVNRFAGQPDEKEIILNRVANIYHNFLTGEQDPEILTRYSQKMLKKHPELADNLDTIFNTLNTWQSITNYQTGNSVVAGTGYIQSITSPNAVSRGNLVKFK